MTNICKLCSEGKYIKIGWDNEFKQYHFIWPETLAMKYKTW